MANADIWMPLYIGDYLADTSRLTTEQHGAYLLLIMDYWRNGPPPDNAQVLAQITRMNADAWSNAQAMLGSFFSIRDGLWHHDRIDSELAAAKANKDKATAKASAAASARWGKQPKDAPSNAPSIPQAMHEECPSPSPSPSKNQGQKISDPAMPDAPKFEPLAVLLADGVETQVAKDWLAIRKTKRLPLTQTAWDSIKREAAKAGMAVGAAVAHSCQRSRAGFEASWLTNEARAGPSAKQKFDPVTFVNQNRITQ